MLKPAINYLSVVCNRDVSGSDSKWEMQVDDEKIIYTKGDMRLEYFEDYDPFIVVIKKSEVLPVLTIRLLNPNMRLLNYLRSVSNFWNTKKGDKIFIYPKVNKISVFGGEDG